MERDAECGDFPGERGWGRWKDIAESSGLAHEPNPLDRGFVASPGRERLKPVAAFALRANTNMHMPGDTGWGPWVKLGCMPRRGSVRHLPPLLPAICGRMDGSHAIVNFRIGADAARRDAYVEF